MKITINSGELSVPENFAFPIKATHPFFSKEGVASAPLELPLDKNNRLLLEWPGEIARANRFKRQLPVMLSSGPFSKHGSMIIDSVGPDSVDACIALQESEVYAKIKDMKIQEVVKGQLISGGYDNKSLPWSLYFHGIQKYSGCALFPVACDRTEEGGFSVLNAIDPSGTGFDDKARTVTLNGEQVEVPAGYGLSMFMYIGYALDIIFEGCGYQVLNNIFETDADLKTLVFLHATADNFTKDYGTAGRPWKCEVSDLLPTVTVGDLIKWLHDKFGIIVIRRETGIDILRFSDLIGKDIDMELDEFIASVENILYSEPKGLRLEFNAGEEPGKPAGADLQAMRKKFLAISEASSASEIPDKTIGLYYINPEGSFYYSDTIGAKYLGSDAFPYTRHISEDEESLKAEDTFAPSVEVNGKLMPYVGRRRHNYVGKQETDPEQPIMICHCFLSSTAKPEDARACGSSYSYEENRIQMLLPDGKPYSTLTPEGLKKNFEAYELMLANGAPTIKAEGILPMDVILSTDWLTPKLLKGAKVMVKELSYTISSHWKSLVKFTLAIIPEYLDAIQIPDVGFNTAYHWEYVNKYPINHPGQKVYDDGLADYTSEDMPKTEPAVLGEIAKLRKRWIKVRELDGFEQGKPEYTYSQIEYDEYFIVAKK